MKLVRILVLLSVLITGLLLPATGASANSSSVTTTTLAIPEDPGFGQ